MSSATTPSIQAAIQQLRAEIIAQDWQLSAQRRIHLKQSLASLGPLFVKRPHALALLKMAGSVVDHPEDDDTQQMAIMEFLKENLAHIVSFYEDDAIYPGREKETALRLYKRFLRLNINLTTESPPETPQPDDNHASPLLNCLEALANEAALLPGLLEEATPLSPQDSTSAALLLGKVSAAINIAWAHLPPASK